MLSAACSSIFFFFQAEDGIRDVAVTGVQTCALPICRRVSGVRLRWHGRAAVQDRGGDSQVPEVRTRSPGRGGDAGGVGGDVGARRAVPLRATVVGGGLAGGEAAWALAERGGAVTLHQMPPDRPTPAHQTDRLAELVCSNSFKSVELTNAHGLLK